MKDRKPTTEQIQEYLKKYNPLDLSGATLNLISEHNHLIYRIEKENKIYCLRMINPETYRAGEWLRIPEEYTILKYLQETELGPKSYFVDAERFVLPLLIQEFISDATCFNELKLLLEKYLRATAQAIALLNSQDITPDNFPFRKGYTRYSYLTSIKTWEKRLAVIKESEQKDVLEWAKKIEKLINQVEKILKQFEPLLEKAPSAFNFDGAHTGNTYWKDDKVIFLDWQKVSHGDPAFTLARFLTSIGKAGEVSSADKEIMVQAYLKERNVPDFAQLVDQRLFERQIADLIWVVWHYVKEKRTDPIEQATSVLPRYERVKKLIEQY